MSIKSDNIVDALHENRIRKGKIKVGDYVEFKTSIDNSLGWRNAFVEYVGQEIVVLRIIFNTDQSIEMPVSREHLMLRGADEYKEEISQLVSDISKYANIVGDNSVTLANYLHFIGYRNVGKQPKSIGKRVKDLYFQAKVFVYSLLTYS